MEEQSDIEKLMIESASESSSFSVDGTSSTARSLTELIALDKYLTAKASMRGPGAGVIFRQIIPPGSV